MFVIDFTHLHCVDRQGFWQVGVRQADVCDAWTGLETFFVSHSHSLPAFCIVLCYMHIAVLSPKKWPVACWWGPVMWSETVGLRTTPVWDQKIGLSLSLAHCGLGLAGLVLCCETRSCNARHDLVTILTHHTATFQVLFIVSLFCTWNITTGTVEINSGIHLLNS